MRYFLKFSYDGTAYHGWQYQPNAVTVQQVMEKAVAIILREPVPMLAAGRTDAGVHAEIMYAHLDIKEAIADKQLFIRRINSLLPQDISVSDLIKVPDGLHARFDATYRTYRYYISAKRDPFIGRYTYRYNGKIDFNAMNKAASILPTYTDFTSFSKLHTDTRTNNCKIYKAQWSRVGDRWCFEITADRFLRNMVRSIVGTLLEVGRGAITTEQFCKIIEAKDRCKAGISMPANALFLTDIGYPDNILNTI